MTEEMSYADLHLLNLYSSSDVVPTTAPISTAPGTFRTVLRKVVSVTPGDVLEVKGWFKVTDDVGYNVGVGAHLWQYDVDNGLGSAGVWTRLDPEHGSVGMNVTPSMHHLTTHIHLPYEVPADWPLDPETGAYHRMCIVLRMDAHSTAAQTGDTLTVDPYGRLTVHRYRPA